MPKISFTKSFESFEVPEGKNLMKALLDGGRPVASSCGGDGVCLKCRIIIVEGRENLSKETSDEKELRDIGGIPKTERISCQTQVIGDVTVDAPYW